MTQGLILAFIALVGLWLLVRMCVFFADRMDSVTLPPDIYLITAWMLRLILIVIAAGVMILAIPGALFAIGMGDAFSGRTSHIAYIVLFSIWIYALAAVVMNFPFFSARMEHERISSSPSCIASMSCGAFAASGLLGLDSYARGIQSFVEAMPNRQNKNMLTMRSTERSPASRSMLGRFAPGTDRATGRGR
jgi:hypothetical protein